MFKYFIIKQNNAENPNEDHFKAWIHVCVFSVWLWLFKPFSTKQNTSHSKTKNVNITMIIQCTCPRLSCIPLHDMWLRIFMDILVFAFAEINEQNAAQKIVHTACFITIVAFWINYCNGYQSCINDWSCWVLINVIKSRQFYYILSYLAEQEQLGSLVTKSLTSWSLKPLITIYFRLKIYIYFVTLVSLNRCLLD